MTGYNHYPSCTCGWCVNYGGRGGSKSIVAAQIPRLDAERLLSSHRVRALSACYVNPNARCPVCGESVYFYANAHGSRVYFDSLGWPWPKHGCTDHPRDRSSPASPPPPVRRAWGITQELVEAAGRAGLNGPGSSAEGWELLVVQNEAKVGGHRTIRAEHLARPGKLMDITYKSARGVVAEGDFISVRGKQVSVLDMETMTAMRFNIGGSVETASSNTKWSGAVEALPPLTIVRPPRETSSPVELTGDLKRDEMKHFHTPHLDLNALCDRLQPVIDGYAKRGIRKPRAVCEQLNRAGFRTACGALWTPRLVRFLKELIFDVPKQNARRVTQGTRVDRPSSAPTPVRTMTVDDMASALARLGRVKRDSVH